MRQCSIWVTIDGVEHKTLERAVRHLEELRGAIVLTLAKEIVAIEKYSAAVDWVDSPRVSELFARMRELESDKSVLGDDTEQLES